ncbi:MAG: CoA ester lyase [Chloroflexi bacterium]|nr:CoA ester lyase [Chloroflexota bacterium]
MDIQARKPHRSCLSVPGSSARMQAKAVTLDADQVLFDLEDATAPSEKVGARQVIVDSLQSLDFDQGRRAVAVRVNGVDTRWCYRDIVDVVEPAGERIDALILPKAESAADVHFVDRLLSQIELARGWPVGRIGLEVLIESAHGLQQVDAIAAASPRLHALIFGPGDLSASLGLGQLTIGMHDDSGYDADIWHYALMRLLVAARVNGLLAIDGPFAAFADLEGLERSARRTAALGFDGKWVIHPSQIETVNRMYSPDPATYARAEGILAAYRQATEGEGCGAVRFEGEMIDEATRKMAEAVAQRGRWLGLHSPSPSGRGPE